MGAQGGTRNIDRTVLYSKPFPSLPSFLLAQGGGSEVDRHIHVSPSHTADGAETLRLPKSTTGSIPHKVGPQKIPDRALIFKSPYYRDREEE